MPAARALGPDGLWIQVGDARSAPGRPSGSVETEALSAGWELTFSGDAEPCKYLPADWLYEAPAAEDQVRRALPATPLRRPAGDRRRRAIELDGWPGMIGHNWGTEHAERWVWLEGTGFEDAPDAYFDAGAARIKLGPWTTPWVPSGMLVLDGEPHRLGGFGKIRAASIEDSPTACAFVLPGKDIVVRGRVSAPQKDFVGWVYADPKGPEHNTVNCSVADLELTVERPARPARTAHPRRRRRLRVRHARDRPRHPDPALPGRLSAASAGRLRYDVPPVARWTPFATARRLRGALERPRPARR